MSCWFVAMEVLQHVANGLGLKPGPIFKRGLILFRSMPDPSRLGSLGSQGIFIPTLQDRLLTWFEFLVKGGFIQEVFFNIDVDGTFTFSGFSFLE